MLPESPGRATYFMKMTRTLNHRSRIGAVIIKRKKLLIVSSADAIHYWTPGGRPLPGESHEQTLRRELKEELSVTLKYFRPYISYEIIIDKERLISHYYLVTFKGEASPQNEIKKITWLSKEDFEQKKLKISKGMNKFLIPKLIKDKKL